MNVFIIVLYFCTGQNYQDQTVPKGNEAKMDDHLFKLGWD